MDDMNLDYKKMFENLQNIVLQKSQQENLYFELLYKVNELEKYTKIMSNKLTSLSMTDQIKILQSVVHYQQICKTLVDKYSFDGGEE